MWADYPKERVLIALLSVGSFSFLPTALSKKNGPNRRTPRQAFHLDNKSCILENQGILMHCVRALCSLHTRWSTQVPGIFSKIVSVWWGSGCWKQVLGTPPHWYLQAQENLSTGSPVRLAQIKNGSRTGKFLPHSATSFKYLLQILDYKWFLTRVSFCIFFSKIYFLLQTKNNTPSYEWCCFYCIP